jgi:hypothetical protein
LERFRFQPRIDLFNAFNSSDYYTVRTLVYGGAAYKQPGSIMLGRIVRFGMNVDF